MTSFLLKLIAIITMLFDHTSLLLYGPGFSWMRCVGRIAFPIFAFQICEGYLHTHNINKYYTRLIIFAIFSEIPFACFTYIFFGSVSLNVIFTLILGLFSIHIYDIFTSIPNNKQKEVQQFYKFVAFVLVLLISFLAQTINTDYGYFGVLLIFSFYIFRNNKKLMNLSVILLTFIYFLPHLIQSHFHRYLVILFLCTLLPLIFINLYNKTKGKDIKWLFYIFYPLHLTIICILHFIF